LLKRNLEPRRPISAAFRREAERVAGMIVERNERLEVGVFTVMVLILALKG
jgi:hypothetical protein